MFKDVTSRYDLSDATIEIIIMLLVAFLLGLLLGYLLSRRCCNKDANQNGNMNSSAGLAGMAAVDTSQAETADLNGSEPNMLSAPNGEADDLKRISGVGPVLEKVLNDTGIYHYKQIAELTSDNIAWLDDKLLFPGRIERENWVGQAKALMDDVKTEFASRYDKGETSNDS